jgi:hypothetical protein
MGCLACILPVSPTNVTKMLLPLLMIDVLVSHFAQQWSLSSRSCSVGVDIVNSCRITVRSELPKRQPATQVDYTNAKRNPGFA